MNKEIGAEGFPSIADNNRMGSGVGELRDDVISVPAGMSAAARAARVNVHQNENESKIIGVPGSTYHPHKSDTIYRSTGGHVLAFGNAPGTETLHIQGKGGQVIEMSQDGSMRITSSSGMHISIGGDGQIVLSGDFCITTNGDFKLKCGNFFLDCTDVNIMANGNKIEHITGDANHRVVGDSHNIVGGDKSNTIGGDARETVAGSVKSQVAGDRRVHTQGSHESSSKGDMMMESKGKIAAASEGDLQLGTQGSMRVQAETNLSVDAKGNTAITSDGHMSTSAKQTMTQTSGDAHTISSKGAMTVKADGAQTFSSKSSQSLTASGTTSIHSGSEIVTAASGALRSSSGSGTAYSTTNPSGGVISPITPNTAGDGDTPRNADTNVANAQPQVADKKTILSFATDAPDTGGEFMFLGTEHGISAYYEDGQIPQKVLDKAKQKGLDVAQWQRENDGGSDQSVESPSYAAGSDWLNPLA